MSATTLEKAMLYEKYRLPYAQEMVSDLLGRIGKVEVMADIGAGTGQLARMFADGCLKIYAIEPDPAMREVATVSLKNYPQIDVVAGSAEETTLRANSTDLIVVGNAFHRFKPEACGELRRILKKQGWVALVRYTFKNKALMDMLTANLSALKTMANKQEKHWHNAPIDNLFGENQRYTLEYPQSQVEDWERFFGAACAGIEAPERTDKEYAAFEASNREGFDAFAVADQIQIDYKTTVTFGQLG